MANTTVRYSDQFADQLLNRFQDGDSLSLLQREFGFAGRESVRALIRRRARARGIVLRPRQRSGNGNGLRGCFADESEIAVMLADYLAGMTGQKAEAKHGHAAATMRSYARRNGIELGKRYRWQKPSAVRQETLRLFDAGASLAEIMTATGKSKGYVSGTLSRCGRGFKKRRLAGLRQDSVLKS